MPQLLVDLPELRQHTMRGNPPLLMGGRRARQRRDFGAAAMEGSHGKLLSEWNRDVSDDAAALHGVHASCFPLPGPRPSSAGGLGGRCDRSLSGPRWGAPDSLGGVRPLRHLRPGLPAGAGPAGSNPCL